MPLINLRLMAWLVLALASAPGAGAAPIVAELTVDTNGSTWTYTIVNNEPGGSSLFVPGIFLTIGNAPIQVTGSPQGWGFDSDLYSYVFWFSLDSDPPYSHDVGPGTALSGFVITSSAPSAPSAYDLSAWNHQLEVAGENASGLVLVPAAVPEPGTWIVTPVILLCALRLRRGANRLRKEPSGCRAVRRRAHP